MRCKHNRLFHENGKFFCFHCGIYIRDDTICEKKYILKECVNTITGVDARQENQMEENTTHVCPKHVLSISQGDETTMPRPKCKMSICKLDELYICALATNVMCDGAQEERGNCPYWKRAGEP